MGRESRSNRLAAMSGGEVVVSKVGIREMQQVFSDGLATVAGLQNAVINALADDIGRAGERGQLQEAQRVLMLFERNIGVLFRELEAKAPEATQ